MRFFSWVEVPFRERRLRQALAALIMMLCAVVVDSFYSFGHGFWGVLSLLCVLQLPRSMTLPQWLREATIVFFIVVGFSWLSQKIVHVSAREATMLLLFTVGYCLALKNPAEDDRLSFNVLVSLLAIVMLVVPPSNGALFERMHDVVLGLIIGIVGKFIFFPLRLDSDFRFGIIPLLIRYQAYWHAIEGLLIAKTSSAEAVAASEKTAIETLLQTRAVLFPRWVFRTGFSPLFQSGQRHFLNKIEKVGQILFALHYLGRHPVEIDLMEPFIAGIKTYGQEATAWMQFFVERLQLVAVSKSDTAFAVTVQSLEKTYRHVIQVPLELLDMAPQYVQIAALIYHLKDLHTALMQLSEALPMEGSVKRR